MCVLGSVLQCDCIEGTFATPFATFLVGVLRAPV